MSLPSGRTGSSASGVSSFSKAVGTGAFGSFFTGGAAAEALGVCEHATACQSTVTESAAESVTIGNAIDALQYDMMTGGGSQLTEPVLNFPKNDIVSSSYADQTTNAPRARRDKLCFSPSGVGFAVFLDRRLVQCAGTDVLPG